MGTLKRETGNSEANYHIGTAGWNIPEQLRTSFPGYGSHLERYSRKFNSVEINSSFERNHKSETYARWAESVPEQFRFSVKLSKHLTHELLIDVSPLETQAAIEGPLAMREKFGVLLIQLPPRLEFNSRKVNRFLEQIRRFYWGAVVIEPRNQSWAQVEAAQVLSNHSVSVVQADPGLVLGIGKAQLDGGKVRYMRLHGSPDIYRSSYGRMILERYRSDLKAIQGQRPVWCIFDNTVYGYATLNALQFTQMMREKAVEEQMKFPLFSADSADSDDHATDKPRH